MFIWALLACTTDVLPTRFEGQTSSYAVVLDLGEPPTVGTEHVTLTVNDDAGPVEGLTVVLDAWMQVHGHGIPGDVPFAEEAPGVYAGDVTWPMPGEWVVWLDVGTESAEFEVVID